MTNQDKKKYLTGYRWGKVQLKQIEHDIIRLRLEALPSAIKYDGMPHGSGGNGADLANYAERLDTMRDRYRKKRDSVLDKLDEIEQAINAVTDDRYRILLHERYINLNGDHLRSFREIGELMGYTEDTVKNMHGEALKVFEVPTATTARDYF